MKEIKILSSKNYEDTSKNYGDCILINTGSELIIYDCGHEEHAKRVIKYMDKHGYKTAKVILSHNDSDHFNGIPTLLDSGRITAVYTTLLLKYKDEICDRIGDGRRSPESIAKALLEIYSNIASLSGQPIYDVFESTPTFGNEVKVVGPTLNYMLDAVAKGLDGREGDTIDSETVVNATSLQVSISFGNGTLLLCGDCSYAAIEDKILTFDGIQLPHHGKKNQGEQIFQKNRENKRTHVRYFVSDNTGNSNGGSDNLNCTGYNVKNTKNDGDITITRDTFSETSIKTGRTLGV